MRINLLKKTLNSYIRKGFWNNFLKIIFPKISEISLMEKLRKRFAELDEVYRKFLVNNRIKIKFKI